MERDGRFVVGDGGVKLLLGVLEHGSLLGAAKEIGWSYRHAWGYLKQAEAALGAPLTTPRPGKGASRGMALTETGRLVLEQLVAVRNQIDDAVGPSGPTSKDIAARGRRRPRRVRRRSTSDAAGRLAHATLTAARRRVPVGASPGQRAPGGGG